ncbi:MAG: metallophosphoesterase [Deltaproteobacteria bacterium]|nr:metallophosphoesterase [Deltaproteobacteria bacterium]
MRRRLPSFLLGSVLVLGSAPAAAANPEGARHARDADGIFWFMHISDSHIGASFIEGPKAKEHLQFALNQAVMIVKPSFVWNTGDLNDGSGKIGVGGTGIPTSGQSASQWEPYKAIYEAAGMKLGFYYDLPGNHDVYADEGATFYLKYSLWGAATKKTWHEFRVSTTTGDYGFFGMNSTNNYFKPLSNCCPSFLDSEIAELGTWLEKNASAKLVFVAAHHALDGNGSEPTGKADQVRALLKVHKAFYLHGDIHDYKEYIDSDSIVVNEVASLGKDNSKNIAIGVVDHDAFVYRATGTDSAWPFAILTTPPSERLRDVGTNPYVYSVCKDRKNNPFRALSFSFTPPTKVALKVAGLPEVIMKPAKGSFDFKYPVWQAEVDTTSLRAGSENVSVRVEADGASNTHQIVARFSDGPCSPLPGDPVEPTDAGADAGPEDAATDADPSADTGAPLPANDDTADQGGCGCRTAGAGDPRRGASLLAGALAFGLVAWRRRMLRRWGVSLNPPG